MDEFAEKLIHGRVHVSPKRLGNPGPDASQKDQILLAANAAPDHCRMMPWRFIEIGQVSRDALGEVFSQCLLDRDQNATSEQLQEAREKALRGPLLLLAIANYADSTNEISKEEKLLSLGCAVQNIFCHLSHSALRAVSAPLFWWRRAAARNVGQHALMSTSPQ